MDERLAWDPATNGGIQNVFVPRTHIWKPQLAVESLYEDLNSYDDSSNVRYDYTGMAVWQQRRHFKLYCKIRKDFFPYQKQTCTLDVVGSSYNISEVNLGFLDTAIDTKFMREAEDFQVTETGKGSSTVDVRVNNTTLLEYPKLEFWIKIERAYQEHYNLFMYPVFTTTFLMGLTFWMQIDIGEKLSYALNLYLAQIFMLIIMPEIMPEDFMRQNSLGSIQHFAGVAALEERVFIALYMYVGLSVGGIVSRSGGP
ncbi:hypothetical protein DPMN_194923 [Dreissena polymorpha]|uniref:Neurotransmitter-gated ion-channel ligand-binding domain-containing protein n=1 Tax=Dreissena polymorpha TaxID=45954 RepID=A0A9D3Y2Z1_DREPO|nr:hypothetical protein DPMN_194923 [Dreissena polymorpha]